MQSRRHRWLRMWVLTCILTLLQLTTSASEIKPRSDDEVIEILPAMSGSRAEARQLRKQLASRPRDTALALKLAQQYLSQAHSTGDPRFAGMALSAIGSWPDDSTSPEAVLMMRASTLQYLHQFDAAAASLQRLLARPSRQPPAQAWLMLATIRRVQGRYHDSDVACAQVERAQAALYASACLAENAALRGDWQVARATFQQLLARSRQSPAIQAWLLTSVAELEQRAARAPSAAVAFTAALRLDPDPYTTLDYVDFLIEQRHPAQALALLQPLSRTDAVLLRLAIAGTQARASSATADVAEMRERIALANQRPDTRIFHGREQAMFALAIDGDALRALQLARGDVSQQREPMDLLVLAQAAHASGDAAAQTEARRLITGMGLIDRRIDALL